MADEFDFEGRVVLEYSGKVVNDFPDQQYPLSLVSKCESGERRIEVVERQELAHLYCNSVNFFVGGPFAGQTRTH